MSLADSVEAVFAAGGLLACSDTHFQPREGQTQMAIAVARTIDRGGVLVVEAGTGVGKTFSYLVPALLSGERVLLSTATKALQDQLFARDLPLLVSTLGVPVRLALLKGRSSYLCLHRMQQARQFGAVDDRSVVRVLAKVEDWSLHTRTGDLAELTGLDDRSPVIPLVTSTRDNCLASSCPRFRECHVYRARREALAADIVVINHHLFFADVAVRESGMAELLPTVRVVVFDEAHQINETGVQFLGLQVSTGQLMDFSRDLRSSGLELARGFADWTELSQRVDLAARDIRLAASDVPVGSRLRWTEETPDALPADTWRSALQAACTSLMNAGEALEGVCDVSPEFVRLCERANDLLTRLASFTGGCDEDQVRWIDVGHQLRLIASPLDIAQAMQTRLLNVPSVTLDADGWPDPADEAVGRAWIFTSATLGEDERLGWFTERAGLTSATLLRVASPFDYSAQAALYVPRHLPQPADPMHSAALAHWVAPVVLALGGRTLILTTTLKALRAIGDELREKWGPAGALEVLVQGDWPKRRLMERFRQGAEHGLPGCVLVASASFWEGFDVPGDALQLVVIDKLPFPPPGDPLAEARIQRIEKAGGKAFKDYALAEAAMSLKQGAGRLIRRESDRGILVVGDVRLVKMGYGKRLLAALPPMRMLVSPQDFDEALQALTKTSTTDPTSP